MCLCISPSLNTPAHQDGGEAHGTTFFLTTPWFWGDTGVGGHKSDIKPRKTLTGGFLISTLTVGTCLHASKCVHWHGPGPSMRRAFTADFLEAVGGEGDPPPVGTRGSRRLTVVWPRVGASRSSGRGGRLGFYQHRGIGVETYIRGNNSLQPTRGAIDWG